MYGKTMCYIRAELPFPCQSMIVEVWAKSNLCKKKYDFCYIPELLPNCSRTAPGSSRVALNSSILNYSVDGNGGIITLGLLKPMHRRPLPKAGLLPQAPNH